MSEISRRSVLDHLIGKIVGQSHKTGSESILVVRAEGRGGGSLALEGAKPDNLSLVTVLGIMNVVEVELPKGDKEE